MVRAAALALVACLAVPAWAGDGGFRSGVFEPPREAPAFSLQGSDGKPLSLDAYRGKVVALVFGFSHCQKVCPVTLANLARVSDGLGARAADFQLVFVTVDPARDTTARLAEYLAFFDPAFRGATGTPAELEAVRTAFGILAEREESPDPRLGYQVHHSSSVFLIDRAGKLRLMAPFGQSADAILHDVRLLLDP